MEQEAKRRKNRKRRRKKRVTSNAQEAQTDSNTKENLDTEEPVTKKIRLDSQTYTITDKDLIQLARIKEKEQYTDAMDDDEHTNGRPVITFSISDNDIVHLELVHDKENGIMENFVKQEQIVNGQFENSNKNGQSKNEIIENINEIEHMTNGSLEYSKINGEIIENSREYGQNHISIQNCYIEKSNEYDQNKSNENFEISIQNDDLLRPKSSKHLPPKLEKYWFQRYLLFSLYDEGIMMDEEGWYSVTPEYLAKYLAKRCACDVIIDAMCGVGGNAIQFAMTCNKVIAIDIDETKLYCARNNASIYGVEDKIEFIQGNFYDLIPQLKADVVFLSPPWGGVSYLSSKIYDIKTMISVDGERLFRESRKITKNIAYYVPRSINFDQLKNLCDPDETCEFQQVVVWEKIKSYVVYYGDLAGNYSSEVIKVPRYFANDT